MDQAEIKEFYSEEAQDIIGVEPAWMIRRGMIVLSLIILALFCMCYFVRYPELVQVPVTMKLNQSGGYDSKVAIDLQIAHKVKLGQKAIIQLTEFPSSSYGLLEASVSGITEGAMDSVYIVDIKLEHGLITSFKNEIEPKRVLYGRVSIIIARTTIFRKIFARLYSF